MAAPIDPNEAIRAVYLDFEGCKSDDPPSILGTLYAPGKRFDGPDVLRQTVTEVALRPLAGSVALPGFPRYTNDAATIDSAIDSITRLAEHQDRRIITWSEHDPQQVLGHVRSGSIVDRFLDRHINAIPTARRWRREVLGLAPTVNTLRSYLDLIGYDLPPGASGGRVGETIRRMRRAVQLRGGFDALTPSQQHAWIDLKLSQHP